MTKFIQIFDLGQDHTDDMIAVQIAGKAQEATFNVRTHHPNMQRLHESFEAAMADVRDRASRNPYLTKLAAMLDEEAAWDDIWGHLE